jgi:DnaK suppressor protein
MAKKIKKAVKKIAKKIIKKISKKTTKKVTKKVAKKVTAKPAKAAAKKVVKNAKFVKMSKADIKFYKALLVAEREKIGGDISSISKDTLKRSQRDASGDLSGYSFHMADNASDNYDVEFSLGRASEEQKLLYVIDDALRRMQEGTYGCCQQCNNNIAKNRLQALPHAALCIECQKANEADK